MHYNLHERLKPKRHIPYRKILIIAGLLLALIALYVLVFHDNGKTPVEPETKVNQPA